jgi:hypothetical protein
MHKIKYKIKRLIKMLNNNSNNESVFIIYFFDLIDNILGKKISLYRTKINLLLRSFLKYFL